MFTITAYDGPRYVEVKIEDQQSAIWLACAIWTAHRTPSIVWSGMTKVFEANRATMETCT